MTGVVTTPTFEQASAAFASGDYADTKQFCLAALERDPNQPAFLHLLALAELRCGESAAAGAHFQQATALNPDDAKLWCNFGAAQEAMRETALAEKSYRQAILLRPDFADAHANLGYLLISLNRLDEAGPHCERAAQLKPNGRAANFNLAFWHFCQHQYTKALPYIKTAADVSPKHAPTWYLFGQIWRDLGRFDLAGSAYLRAVELDPNQADAALNYAIMQLAQENYATGWHFYFQRPRGLDPADSLTPITPGASLAGKRVLLTGDQGIGDQLFFLRFAPALVRQGARVSCRPDPKLAPLLRRLPWVESVLAPGQPFNGDFTFATADLPLMLQIQSRNEIPPPLPLTARSELIDEMAQQLAALGPPPYIAVTWRAGKMRKAAMNYYLFKSITPSALGQSLSTVQGTVVIIQRQPSKEELADFSVALGRPAYDFSHLNDDLERMLALLSCVSQYVTVSNTNVHLRSSLGLPSHTLVAHPPEWRWLWKGESSPWYPGTKIYRQQANGDWDAALQNLRADLNSN